MPTKPKTYPFAIYRTDNSYLIHDLTRKEYETIMEDLENGRKFSPVSIGLIGLSDIRAIIEQKEEPKPKEKKEKPAVPDMTLEEAEYLRELMRGVYDEEDEGVDYQ